MKKLIVIILLFILPVSLLAQVDLNTFPTVVNKTTIGTGDQNTTLGAITTYYDDEHLVFKNNGTGSFTVNAAIGETIENSASYVLENEFEFLGLVKDPNNPTNWSAINWRGPPQQVGYTIFPIWAEESGGLSNNNTQWSYGNGATGTIGVPIPEAELFAVGFEADVAGTSVSIEVMQNNVTAVTSQLFLGASGYNLLTTPIQFNEGDIVGFRTDVETGAYSDARAIAWFRIPLLGLKGEKGDAGVDGIPNQILRTNLDVVANANVTGTSFMYNTAPQVQTTGTNVTVNANNIVLEAGTYGVKIKPNYDTTASGVQRPAIGARFFLDGVQYGDDHFSMSYIRDNSAHDQAGDYYEDVFTIAAQTTFTATTLQQSTAGTVLLSGGRLIIIKYN